MKTYKELLAEVRSFYDWIGNPNSRPNFAWSKFTPEESESIRAYTQHPFHSLKHASSHDINGYLRRRANPDHEETPWEGADIKVVHDNAMRLARAWRPETTNTSPVKLYSGIPEEEGHRWMKHTPGQAGYMAGFTSASNSKRAAASFSGGSHFLSIRAKPGTVISVGHETPSYGESESIIRYGTKYTYHGTESMRDGNDMVHVHKVTVHPSFKDIHGYPEYRDNEGRNFK